MLAEAVRTAVRVRSISPSGLIRRPNRDTLCAGRVRPKRLASGASAVSPAPPSGRLVRVLRVADGSVVAVRIREAFLVGHGFCSNLCLQVRVVYIPPRGIY